MNIIIQVKDIGHIEGENNVNRACIIANKLSFTNLGFKFHERNIIHTKNDLDYVLSFSKNSIYVYDEIQTKSKIFAHNLKKLGVEDFSDLENLALDDSELETSNELINMDGLIDGEFFKIETSSKKIINKIIELMDGD